MRRIFLMLALVLALHHAACGAGYSTISDTSPESVAQKSPEKTDTMKISLKIKDRVLSAALVDSKTTRDFVSLLPLTLTMNDLFGREKYGHLPRELSEGGERTHTYEVGEVVYWSPGPDVAIFYRHDRQSIPDPGIIVIGKIDSGVEALNLDGLVRVTIELANQSLNQTKVGETSNALPAAVPTLEDLRTVAPAFAKYTEGPLLDGLWKRPDLSPRDRSIITISALIARNQTIEMPYHFNLALDNGVKPSELSEIITHLAFYSGWANATSAVAVAKEIFAKRGIVPTSLPRVSFCRSMKLPKHNVRPGSSRMPVPWLRELYSTPATCFFMISGSVRPLRLVIGAWSRSARLLPQAKPRKSPIISIGRWITV